MRVGSCQYVVIGVSLAGVIAILAWALSLPGTETTIGSYSTSLEGRTLSQSYNAELAARRIDGTVVGPGCTFSFNKAVGSWSQDTGYEKAPVSYDGELIKSWGGGVCQTSTTLYAAALYAGMDIIERHPHHWPAKYAPPGLDAAVAYSSVDLRFRNPLPWPVRISARSRGRRLVCGILCSHRPGYVAKVKREIRSVAPASEVVQESAFEESRRLVNPGQPGLQVVVYRDLGKTAAHWHVISDDYYPAMNRIIRVRRAL